MPSINLSWTAVAGAAKYTIYRSTDGSRGTAIGTSTQPAYVDSTAAPGTTYTYGVTDSNAVGESALSAQVQATIQVVQQEPQPTGDFASRIAQPGVFRSHGFANVADLGINMNGQPLGDTPTTSFGYNLAPFATTGNPLPTFDADSATADGSGSVRAAFPPQSGGQGGKWESRFSDDDSITFGPNSKFYFQFRYKHDGMLTETGGTNPEGVKLGFLGPSGDIANGVTGCPALLILQTYYSSAILSPYCYAYVPTGPTPYSGTFGIAKTTELPEAARIPANEWVTFSGYIELGNWMAVPLNYHVDCHIVIDMIRADGTRVNIVDYGPGWTYAYGGTSYIGFPMMDTNPDAPRAFGKVSFLPYTTSRDTTTITPGKTYNFWWDELILSRQAIPDPSTTYPAWRVPLANATLNDITQDGSTTRSAYVAAGFDKIAAEGNPQPTQNLLAWGAGIHAPDLGPFGAMIFGANGHEAGPASTLSYFDLESATMKPPIGPPQIYSGTTPPADAECWIDVNKATVGLFDITNYSYTAQSDYFGKGTVLTGEAAVGVEWSETGKEYPSGIWSRGYAYRPWPPSHGFRYDTNVATGIRYNNLVVVPNAGAGMLYAYAPGMAHIFTSAPGFKGNGTTGIALVNGKTLHTIGDRQTCGFDLSAPAWVSRSADEPPTGFGGNASFAGPGAVVVYSPKHKRVVAAGSQDSLYLGTYDPLTRTHDWLNARADAYISALFKDPNNGVVTEGFDAELLLFFARSYWSGSFGIGIYDLDACFANPKTGTWVTPYIAINAGDSDAAASAQALPLLALTWITDAAYGSGNVTLDWSKQYQKLIVWQSPIAAQDYPAANNGAQPATINATRTGYVAPLRDGNLHVVTIPSGATAGVPNWRTQPWKCTKVPLTLGNAKGVACGQVGGNYNRNAWSDKLGMFILAQNPVDYSVQGIPLDLSAL